MNITPADKEKKLIRLALWWFKRKYKKGEHSKSIKDDMEHCGNPVIRKVRKLIKEECIDNISEYEKHQREAIEEVGTFLLWILYKDTAYRQPAMWLLEKLYEKEDEIRPHIKKYLTKPENWYVNEWSKSKQITKEKRENGELADGHFSDAETYFVPELQQERFKKINKEIEKQKRKKGW